MFSLVAFVSAFGTFVALFLAGSGFAVITTGFQNGIEG